MKLLALFLALVGLSRCSVVEDQVETFDGDIVIQVTPRTPEQLATLGLMMRKAPMVDFWREPKTVGQAVEIHLPRDQQDFPLKFFKAYGFDAEVVIEDLGALIAGEKRNLESRWSDWTSYESLESIEGFLVQTADAYDFVSLSSVGNSYEGRDVWMLNINKPNEEGLPKKVAVLEFQIHAREWISSAVGTWMINELLTNPAYDEILQTWDFHIFPISNPDGFAFTKTNNRLWRKTRSDHNSIFGCRGVDPNRNWDWSFAGPGTSNDKCSEIYHGPEAFSESEVKAISDYVLNMSPRADIYLSFHSYSQFILLPWGDTTVPPDDVDELLDVGLAGEAALEAVYGTQYETGTIPDLLNLAAGSSIDWVKGAAGVKWTFAYELRDKGQYGFLLPADQIIPCAEETFAGVIAMLNALP
ncbi:unnamed protein product [Cyprideis torosa]|uniref:Peptidase M14 domain-containing protein n=1 Tax=Cyprideis torosa TaxID=163714 RepID=A0A7R8WBS5_9CRUS|nr:unnamed protein product [Cyprideis torosa]CAG0892575.1 unnamed protein product [Cyprideis torosa]